MVTTHSNGFASSALVGIRENGVHNAYPDTTTAGRHRRRHQWAAILLVLVLFLGSAAHLVVRISGKRHVRHRQDYHQQDSSNEVASSPAIVGQQESVTDASLMVKHDNDETNPLSPSHVTPSNKKKIPEKPRPLDKANQQALADSHLATSYNTTVSLGKKKRVSAPQKNSNSSIPVDNQQHKAS